MKHYLSFLIFILLVVTLSGCKKEWLDAKADKEQTIPSNLTDYQELLDNTSNVNNDGITLTEVAADGHYTSEEAWLSGSVTDRARNAYTWTYAKPYIDYLSNTPGPWTVTYKRVYYANTVLDGLAKIKPENIIQQQLLDNIRGQALFHRADAFYRIAQTWAPPYIQTTANINLGIPLRLESDVNIPSVRSSVEQTYNQIISDLTEAQKLLPDVPPDYARPSKPAVFGLLARTYMSMCNYAKAEEFADSCLDLYNSLIDYNDLPVNSNFVGNLNTNPEVIFHITNDPYQVGGFLSFQCYIDSAFYASYNDNDLRKVIYFKQNSSGKIAFKGNYNNNATKLFVGIATDEMYLTRAECYARNGNLEGALLDLNTLMIKRWKNNGSWVPFTAANVDEALNRILVERRKELLLRNIRWTDLRGLNQEDRFKITVSRFIGGQTFTLEPNSYKYTFPIPDDIIASSGMQQNPGW